MSPNDTGLPVYVYLLIALGVALLASVVVFIIVKIAKNKKIQESEEQANRVVAETASALASCFGGNENIKGITQRGSRVTIEVNDPLAVNKEEIDSHFQGAMYMGNKVVLVVGSKSEEFSKLLQENVDKIKQ